MSLRTSATTKATLCQLETGVAQVKTTWVVGALQSFTPWMRMQAWTRWAIWELKSQALIGGIRTVRGHLPKATQTFKWGLYSGA